MSEPTSATSTLPATAPVFPLGTIRLGIGLMVLMLSLSTLLTWQMGRQMRDVIGSQIRVLTAVERIAHYGDVLELSIRAVVSDGDPQAAARYRRVQPELRRTLQELRTTVRLRDNVSTAAQVDAADLALVELEHRALALVDQGRYEQARSVIDDPAYAGLLRTYTEGVARIQARATAYVAASERELRNYFRVILGFSVASFLLIAFAWMLLVRPTRAWGRQLDSARMVAEDATRKLAVQQSELEVLNRQLFEQARTDPLTGLATRLSMGEDLQALATSTDESRASYCAVMGDIDFFKRYNDRYGHLAGDEVLRRVASTLLENCRAGDRLYRYGGEEFLVIMPGDDLDGARAGAERYRAAIAALALPHEDSPLGVVTISLGMAVLGDGGVDAWLEAADRALYEAKAAGRNRVAVSP